MTIMDDARFSPMLGNPLKTRQDVQDAFTTMFKALVPAFSPGCARVRVDQAGAHFDVGAADVEGLIRPLWGIVPMVAGGGKFDYWHLYHTGITNGTDPDHEEYWGACTDYDQRLVEMAAIGFALALVPEHIWTPLSDMAKANLAEFLLTARNCHYHDCNWKYFRVLVDLGLKNVGVEYDANMTDQYLQDLDSYYLGDGFYGDGPDSRRMDYYVAWAFHFYGLVYARLCPEDQERQERYRERARMFAQHFQHWFADDGSCIPFGRSLIYRFASGSFWGACAFADEEVLPWGVIKGLFLRHLRWWAQQPVSRLDNGILSLGYAYPNAFVCENYNSPQSPYWAFKAFVVLALDESHPFWSTTEIQPSALPLAAQRIPGMVITHHPKNTVALMSGPCHLPSTVRFAAYKYNKMAYSTRYGFSIDANPYGFDGAALDSMIGFSEDGLQFSVRHETRAKMYKDCLYSTWSPYKDVEVETWLIPKGKWHIRVHKVSSARKLQTIEGGFAIANKMRIDRDIKPDCEDRVYTTNDDDFSGIVDLSRNRTPRICHPEANSNIMVPRTRVPQLVGAIEANSVVTFSCAVLAQPEPALLAGDWLKVPDSPSEDDLADIKALGQDCLQSIE
ncbi:hypothetical protein BC940DRAFT_298546 [Gongronella butleri]|nr:hypothetical protein BC940DRAFT_298546 [Gongronella butleri]